MSAASIARALGGHSCGAGGFLCRCPVQTHGKGEGDRRPSLSIRDGDSALLVRSFAGCAAENVIDELRRRGLLDDDGGGRREHARRLLAQVSPPEPEPDTDALALWQAAAPMAGTLGERYLRLHRRISLDPPPSLRFHPDVVHQRTGHRFSAVVAAVQRPDRKIIAVQMTYLKPSDGSKAPLRAPRLTVGRLGTGAIRLGPAGDVLRLAEGMETALSAMTLSGVSCWAALGGQRLGKVTVPATVREVHIFGDDDDAGRLAGELAAGRYSRDGLRVVLRWPPDGCGDWNVALQARMAPA